MKARTRTVLDEAGSPEFRFSADVPLELEDNRVRVSALGDNGQTAQNDYDVHLSPGEFTWQRIGEAGGVEAVSLLISDPVRSWVTES